MSKDRIQPIVRTVFNAANLLGPFQEINPNGLPEACFLIRILNHSNVDVELSYDGLNAHDRLAAGETLQLPFQANAVGNNLKAFLPKGSHVYVSGDVPGIGRIFLIGYFQARG